MDHLPPELWAQVCSLSDIKSLKRLRLANSGFTQTAARYLFEGLCVTLIPKYLDKVTEVASHPSLRFYVRTLYFDYTTLHKGSADYNVWEDEFDNTIFYRQETMVEDQKEVVMSQAELKRHHANFSQLLASQEACFDDRTDLATLSAALTMLPNLRAIRSMGEAFGYCTTPISSVLQNSTLPRQSCIGRPLASLLFGLGLTRRQIVTMEMDPISWRFWHDDGPSGFLYDVRQLIHLAFRCLESMIVCFFIDIEDLEVRLQSLLPTSITTFVAAAQRLRSLDISFYCYYGEHDGSDLEDTHWLEKPPNMGQVFGALTLPNLVSFRLSYCTLPEKILQDFIIRHTTTLKGICMSVVTLDNGSDKSTSWENTLRLIAPISFLDRVALSSLYCDDIINEVLAEDPDVVAANHRHSEYCKALAAFLLKRGRAKCPRIADYAKQ